MAKTRSDDEVQQQKHIRKVNWRKLPAYFDRHKQGTMFVPGAVRDLCEEYPEISQGQWLMCHKIAEYLNASGTCYASSSVLAGQVFASKSTIKRWIDDLVAKKILVTRQLFRGRRSLTFYDPTLIERLLRKDGRSDRVITYPKEGKFHLSLTELSIFTAIVYYRHYKECECFFQSNETLAQSLGITTRTAKRAIQRLEQLKLIYRVLYSKPGKGMIKTRIIVPIERKDQLDLGLHKYAIRCDRGFNLFRLYTKDTKAGKRYEPQKTSPMG